MLVTLSATLGLLASCSSTPVTDSAEVESEANNEAFSALVDSEPVADTGAIVDQSSPMLVADASSTQPTMSDATYGSSEQSPVNLGASSAGRAH
jgi:hypothetical protein